jgi:hypothetical protein
MACEQSMWGIRVAHAARRARDGWNCRNPNAEYVILRDSSRNEERVETATDTILI